MRVISLRQPWATLVSLGAKSRETRSWYTSYRGPIAIHASAGIDARVKKACSLPPVRDVLTGEGYENWRDLPRGCRQLSLLENADSRARKEEWSRLAVTPAGGRPLGTHMRRAPHRPHDRGVDRDAEGLVRALSEPSLRQYRPPTTRGCRPNGLAC